MSTVNGLLSPFRIGARDVARWATRLRTSPIWPFVRPFVPSRYINFRRILTVLQTAPEATSLDVKLWGGFSSYASADLENLRNSLFAPSEEQQYAAWHLARWHAFHGDEQQALNYLGFMRRAVRKRRRSIEHILLEAECLQQLGHDNYARQMLDEERRVRPHDHDLLLAYANTFAPAAGKAANPEDDAARIEWINRVYTRRGYAALDKRDPAQPLSLHNLCAPGARISTNRSLPKISVIVPAYNAADTIGMALQSLLDQTWWNLEILVVDDCSTDGTVDVISEFAGMDSRVKLLRHERNRGSYAARNTALPHTTGAYITTHDSDDWSHPEKLMALGSTLRRSVYWSGVLSHWARTTPDLRFKRQWHQSTNLIQVSYSSFMFTRKALERLGCWDNVRVGADAELIWRARRLFGNRVNGRVSHDVPLSFSRFDPGSLTQAGPTHIRTTFFGQRQVYNQAAKWWHSHVPSLEALRYSPDSAVRPFPAPGYLHPERKTHERYDLVFVSDFSLDGGAFVSTFNYMLSAIAEGKSVAAFHWRRYDLNVDRPLNAKLRDLAQARKVSVLAPGQPVSAEAIIVGYPAILQHQIDDVPQVNAPRLAVLVNQMASRFYSGGDVQYDPLVARKHLQERFGTVGSWIPISGLVRRLMRDDPRYPEPYRENWTPLLDTAFWCQAPLRWRGKARKRPVAGRHGRDNYSKWPGIAGALRDAYLAGKPCDVRLLGGANAAVDLIGRVPSNWRIFDFNAIEPRDFLTGLDFFVHFPHEDYVEEFGRAVIEAMAVGIPVILPPVFRDTFGDAAIYAEPKEVWDVMSTLWSDESTYLERARAGREHVLRNCGHEHFSARLKNLLS